ncbi:MAG: TonB-dependent receptor [Gammaproteobacteria bacterium]|nr:TonB-dependent receptor [Gammaproteobacteria bacterium]
MKSPILTFSSQSCLIFCLASCYFALQPAYAQQPPIDDILDLGLEDLLSMEVTSVSRKKQRLTESAAAIYVITQEDIRRSGVTSIPEALRMAPGIQVAKMDSNKWAISSRGFNAQFANKLLVLIDGRSVYTPSYSGVYWEVQNTMLKDIDRIEVIRGPGATIWGANAVNGVINIITRSATETRGGVVVARAGNEEKSQLAMRYGFDLGEQSSARVYFKSSDYDSSYATELDNDAGDEWSNYQGGFRMEIPLSTRDQLTLQGDAYRADENQIIRLEWLDPALAENNPPDQNLPFRKVNNPDIIDSSGHNLLARWQRTGEGGLNSTLQIYLDQTKRQELILDQRHDILDIDFTQHYNGWESHNIIWGAGYRRTENDNISSFNVAILKASESTSLVSAFIQDEIVLKPETLRLTLGVKLEDSDYTGVETQPSARIVWLATSKQTLWASVSHAVRTPSQIETSGRIVTSIFVNPFITPVTTGDVIYANGSDTFDSEKLNAFELGYRVQPNERLSLDFALFRNEYRDLNTFEVTGVQSLANPFDPANPVLIPSGFVFDNKRDASSQGIELSADWYATESWRLQLSYSTLRIDAENHTDSGDTITISSVVGSAPKNQWSLRSLHTLSDSMTLDLWLYRNDELKNTSFSIPTAIPAYSSFNARLGWKIQHNLEFAVVGHNLLADQHKEFAGEGFISRTEVERSLYAQLRWDF